MATSDNSYQFIVIGFCGLSFIIIFISCIHGRRNDFYSATALISAAFQILDLISDLFFCLKMLSTSLFHLFIASVTSIVLPSALSLVQLFFAVKKWKSIGDDMLTAWLFHRSFGLYALSMVTGSAFNGVQICRSDMFGIPQFAMPLNEKQIVEFQSKKLWTTVMLEVKCKFSMSFQ